MAKKLTVDKTKKFYDLRALIPIELGEMFINEAKKERRKHGPQITKILEDRYLTKEQ